MTENKYLEKIANQFSDKALETYHAYRGLKMLTRMNIPATDKELLKADMQSLGKVIKNDLKMEPARRAGAAAGAVAEAANNRIVQNSLLALGAASALHGVSKKLRAAPVKSKVIYDPKRLKLLVGGLGTAGALGEAGYLASRKN